GTLQDKARLTVLSSKDSRAYFCVDHLANDGNTIPQALSSQPSRPLDYPFLDNISTEGMEQGNEKGEEPLRSHFSGKPWKVIEKCCICGELTYAQCETPGDPKERAAFLEKLGLRTIGDLLKYGVSNSGK
ncbi:hypothetical protein PMAYCL1PPCAC_08301, partial [Pristionchus mayeri]